MTAPFTVAIDGPAASGKGTLSKALAAHFGFAHLDTGLLYRAVGRRMMNGEDPVVAAGALVAADLEGEDLRGPKVAQAASKVAVIEAVRAALVDFQRAFARRDGGAVLDGRDIGTVICPEAEVKIYVTASDEVRAGRRYAELVARGLDADPDEVLADLRARDARDSGRAAAPMRAAADAVVLDSSELGAAEVLARAVAIVEGRRG
ncbi:MAG: d(CMP) kinase [Pseudomonadota bacterium]